MAREDMPFDEDMMTLIMGIDPDSPNPSKPGQHGPKEMPMPEDDLVDTLTKIRDLCEDALHKVGKESSGFEDDGAEDESKDKKKEKEDNDEF